MKKIFKYLLFSLFLLVSAPSAFAVEDINVYFFYGKGCPHCAKEEILLDKLEKESENIKVNRYEVWGSKENASLLQKAAEALNIESSGVPVTIIGDQYIIGYDEEDTTGVEIRSLIADYRPSVSRDVVGEILNQEVKEKEKKKSLSADAKNKNVSVPFWGRVNLKDFSLPILTILIGTLDSFNPCAMWVLLLLISMMIGMKDRGRMWLLGLTFIISSAVAYFVFLSAWLNIYLFIGYISWIRTAIALAAIFSGILALRQFWKNRNGGCEIETSGNQRKYIIRKMREAVESKKFLLALAGVAILAVAVNLLELLCSAGLPAVYVPILTLADLASWQYYSYLALYAFFYVFIQLVVFLATMFTFRVQAISSRITKWSGLVGGVVMLLIGLLLIFAPSWLTLG
ncbi:MAG: hypothetical protein UT48_C0001G0071 [Parcubacteria group bacterium GW2011_GWE2_39_37]|uniref:Thioredoxin domain-containing protein n=1 Tax=Candidatus Falkowbacteria bacterium GW2011_GWF2_39_8 TaxID=1618642 RepID=A0A0G0SG85_9BACT|nr:MAG: hypothetical protein UT48_C0001G0071 [Parcubacteria group bacterium GW2011_GWE2_39_37]KKR33720.1 MAG: hypothetical protein UT64_C0004G0027 [Candidatus Falkowbacteria bacterium GW2011_GWF2_39_8]